MYLQFILYCIYFIINNVAGEDIFHQIIEPHKYGITTPWPNARIPYQIIGRFSPTGHQNVLNAMNEFHKYTCVQFVPHNNEPVYIRIIADSSSHCRSGIGFTGQIYDVNIPELGCGKLKQIEHELMHTLGFLHEHNRHDRDTVVNVYRQNIAMNGIQDFIKREPNPQDTAYPYDYNSVVHYSSSDFSINGQPTIVAKLNSNIVLGPINGLSATDIQKINDKYSCPATSPSSLQDTVVGQQNFHEFHPEVQTQPPANNYDSTMFPVSNTNVPTTSGLSNTGYINSNIRVRVYSDQNPNNPRIRLRVYPNAQINSNVPNVGSVYPSLTGSQNNNFVVGEYL